MKTLSLTLLLLSCNAVAMDNHEKLFHALNVIDMVQTIQGAAKDPCYHEANPITAAMIGEHPSVEGVILSSLLYSVAYHYSVKAIKKSKMPKWTKNFTFSLSIGLKGATVIRNHDVGVRLDGHNRGCM